MDDDLVALREEVARAALECADGLLLDLVYKMLVTDGIQ